MARGFLSGVLWGGLLSVGVSGVASVMAPPPMPPEVSDAAPGVSVAPEQTANATSGDQSSQSDSALATPPGASQTTVPAPDTLAGIDADVVASAAVPETGAAEGLQTPVAVSDGGSEAPQADDPVLPNPQALAPMEPQAAEELSISTEPAQPPAPQTETVQGAFDAPAQPVAEDSVAPEAALPDVNDAAPDTSVSSAVAPVVDDAPAVDQPEPAIKPVAPPPTVIAQAPQTSPDPQPQGTTDDPVNAASARPAIGTPAVSLTERAGGVTVNRLTNGTAPAEEAATESTAGEDATQADITAKPIEAFAQPFENPDNKPLMGIVLIDDGTSPISGSSGIAALRSFPYPLSFAVDSALPDAADRMALYRKEGFEVLAMVDLPEGAAAADAETTFGVTLAKLPEVVGILEGTKGGVQGSRDVSDQVTAILAQSGHGLVTQDKGLNTMPKLARKDGVPADPVFRDFDSKGQTAQVIRRFLDQAAFRAGQEGAVIMLGRLQPDTISALLLWGLQDRAGQVALAPISAVLLRAE